jgi:hypothetical protein
MTTCNECDTPLQGQQIRWCSNNHRVRHMNRLRSKARKKPRTPRYPRCMQCGEPNPPPHPKGGTRMYCDDTCERKARADRDRLKMQLLLIDLWEHGAKHPSLTAPPDDKVEAILKMARVWR